MIVKTPAQPASHLALAALLAPAVLLVFVPVDLYVANRPFMSFPLVSHLLLAIPAVLLTAACLYFALRLAPRRGALLATPILTAAGLAAWVLATFVRDGGNVLLGRQFIVAPQPSPPSVFYYAAAIGLLVGFAYLGRWRPAAVARLGWTLLGLLTAYATYAAITDSTRMPDVLGRAKVTQFAQTQPNVVVLLVDALQNDLALSILEEDPRLADELEGFVYYRNAISTSPTTYGSIPAIHSGVTLQATSSLSEAYELGVTKGSFMASLARQGYATSVVNPTRGTCPEDVAFCSSTYVTVEGFLRSVASQALYLVDLTIYRLAPRELRDEIYGEGGWLLSGAVPMGRQSQHAVATMGGFTTLALDSPVPTARFIHLFHAHAPFTVDRHCREQSASYEPEAAKPAAHCALRMIASMARTLRSRGIYDNTLIIVVADHGLAIVARSDGTLAYEYADPFRRMVTQAAAALAVKRFGASGPLAVSDDLASIGDVRRMVCEQTGACGPSGTLAEGRAGRSAPTRRFSHYDWEAQFHYAVSQDELSAVRHFIVRGDHRKPWSWMPTADHSEFEVSRVTFSAKDPEAVFGPGWSVPHGSGEHTWRCAIGEAAQLYLNLPDGAPKLTFFLKNNPANVDQRVTVRLNGTPIEEFRPSAAGASHSIRVPETFRGRTPAVVTFSFSQSIPPPGDPRPIGGCFFNLVVENG